VQEKLSMDSSYRKLSFNPILSDDNNKDIAESDGVVKNAEEEKTEQEEEVKQEHVHHKDESSFMITSIEALQSVNDRAYDAEWDDEKLAPKLLGYETTISEQFLRISGRQVKMVLNQESFYRFGKILTDSSHPYTAILLGRSSGVYYVMGILMMRLQEYKKCEFYLSECIRLYQQNEKKDKKNENTTLRSFYYADIAWAKYNDNKYDQAMKYMKIAVEQSTMIGYISVINAIINGDGKSIPDVIKALDNIKSNQDAAEDEQTASTGKQKQKEKSNLNVLNEDEEDEHEAKSMDQENTNSEHSFFARFMYALWLAQRDEYDKSKTQFEILLEQFTNQVKEKEIIKPRQRKPKKEGKNGKIQDALVLMNGLVHYEFGRLLAKNKQTDEAKQQFMAALKIEPCLPNVYENSNQQIRMLDDKHNLNDFRYNSDDGDDDEIVGFDDEENDAM